MFVRLNPRARRGQRAQLQAAGVTDPGPTGSMSRASLHGASGTAQPRTNGAAATPDDRLRTAIPASVADPSATRAGPHGHSRPAPRPPVTGGTPAMPCDTTTRVVPLNHPPPVPRPPSAAIRPPESRPSTTGLWPLDHQMQRYDHSTCVPQPPASGPSATKCRDTASRYG